MFKGASHSLAKRNELITAEGSNGDPAKRFEMHVSGRQGSRKGKV
jgi:hypothetical protein